MGDRFDLLQVARHAVFANAPKAGLAVVVRDEERRFTEPRVHLALHVVLGRDADVVGLVLDHQQRRIALGLVLRAAPHHMIGAGLRAASARHFLFFADLLDGVAVLICEHAQEFLAHAFFGRFKYPFAANMAEYLALVVAFNDGFGFLLGSCHSSSGAVSMMSSAKARL